MSLRDKKYTQVSHRIENNFAYMLEEMLFYIMPSNELMKEYLKDETVAKFNSFYDALSDEAGHIRCDEFEGSYIMEYGKNFVNANL